MTASAPGGLDRQSADSETARIGLLGGSFNPAHSGHVHISELALDLLDLDEVWWLVSPRNPMKEADELLALDERIARARETAAHEPRIRVSDFERELKTVFTVDTVQALRQRFPATRFVWIMGADNLAQLHRWHGWETLFDQVPVAVFDRPTYSFRALEGAAARKFATARIGRSDAATLADLTPPAWVFLWTAFDTASSTAIRAESDETA